MIPELLWIIGLYMAAAAVAHRLVLRSEVRRRRYVLVAGNHQLLIEGYVRALRRLSRRTGADIGITVVLENSSDETGRIVERIARHDEAVTLVRGGAAEERAEMKADAVPDQVVRVDLGNREQSAELPL